MKRLILLFLIIACTVFAGDLSKLTKWDEPLIFEQKNFEILGSGLDSYIGDLVIWEAAIKNDGSNIDILKITVVFKEIGTEFPLFQVEFLEIDIPTGVKILKSSPFSLAELGEALKDKEKIQVWSVDITRL